VVGKLVKTYRRETAILKMRNNTQNNKKTQNTQNIKHMQNKKQTYKEG